MTMKMRTKARQRLVLFFLRKGCWDEESLFDYNVSFVDFDCVW